MTLLKNFLWAFQNTDIAQHFFEGSKIGDTHLILPLKQPHERYYVYIYVSSETCFFSSPGERFLVDRKAPSARQDIISECSNLDNQTLSGLNDSPHNYNIIIMKIDLNKVSQSSQRLSRWKFSWSFPALDEMLKWLKVTNLLTFLIKRVLAGMGAISLT